MLGLNRLSIQSEMILLLLIVGHADDEVGIRAVEDLKVLVFDNHAIGELLQNSPTLASEIGDVIESRRQAAQSVRYRR